MNAEPAQDKSVDDVLKQIDYQKLGEPAGAPAARPPLPPRIRLIDRGAELEIVRTWFGWDTVLTTAGLAFCGGILLLGIQGAANLSGLPLFTAVALTGLLAYLSLSGWLNRTHIVVDSTKVTVRHGPIPSLGNKDIPVSSLQQLRTRQVEHHRSRGSGTYYTYEVHACTGDNPHVKLVTGLRSRAQAQFIEQQIEKYLGIQDWDGGRVIPEYD